MDWKKKLLARCRLYLILDAEVNSIPEMLGIARQAGGLGLGPLQLRDKRGDARDTLRASQELIKLAGPQVPMIINDRADICLAVNAIGVHVGQQDLPAGQVRKLIGPEKILGVSCQTYDQARRAESDGADYIGFGSVFATQTKPDREPMDLALLQKVVCDIGIPVYAIGGIDSGNIPALLDIGVTHFAVCRAICEADDMVLATRELLNVINSYEKATCE